MFIFWSTCFGSKLKQKMIIPMKRKQILKREDIQETVDKPDFSFEPATRKGNNLQPSDESKTPSMPLCISPATALSDSKRKEFMKRVMESPESLMEVEPR